MGHIKEWVKHIALWILIGMGIFILAIIANSVIRGDKIDPDDPRPGNHLYNYWHPDWDHLRPQTIIPDGQGIIEYEDGTVDSIRWRSDSVMDRLEWNCGQYHNLPIMTDEWQMWITGQGDTIWE